MAWPIRVSAASVVRIDTFICFCLLSFRFSLMQSSIEWENVKKERDFGVGRFGGGAGVVCAGRRTKPGCDGIQRRGKACGEISAVEWRIGRLQERRDRRNHGRLEQGQGTAVLAEVRGDSEERGAQAGCGYVEH